MGQDLQKEDAPRGAGWSLCKHMSSLRLERKDSHFNVILSGQLGFDTYEVKTVKVQNHE